MTASDFDISPEWADILGRLPGYDPFAQGYGCTFDVAAAQAALDFFPECIKHVKGAEAGKPFVLAPWQQSLVANLFGWKRADGTRRFREVFLYVAKKNGKTAVAAGLILYALCCDNELGAEIYSAAASRDQAALVFQHAAGMVRLEPALSSRLRVFGDSGGSQIRTIVFHEAMSSYKCLAADAHTADGVNPHFVVVDELHRHKSPELAEVLQKSTAARRQPVVIYTTTADYNRPSLCNTKLAYARHVRDNRGDESQPGYDPGFLPVIYECTKDDDWKSPDAWRKANPNMGVTVPEDFLARECKKAQETPSELNNFLRLHLNIVTDADESWIPMDLWDGCAREVNETALAGRTCFGALDLSSKLDISAWGLVFPPADSDPYWSVLVRLFIPEHSLEAREKKDRVPYRTWIRQGFLFTTTGDVVDYEAIKARVMEDHKRFDVREVAFDPWNANQIALQLQDLGAHPVEFGQGYKSMSEPAKEWERLVVQKRLAHGGHPVLRWMMGNTTIEKDPAGNIKPSKAKSTEKIDGIVAGIMGMGRAMVSDLGVSIYETQGIEAL